MNRTSIVALLLTLIAAPAASQDVLTNRTANDRHALNAIFHEQHIGDNALAIHRRAVTLPADERYEFLADWVLPNSDHDTIRMALTFTPTHPAPPVQGQEAADVRRLRTAEQKSLSRVQIGGRLVAPAVDLVAVAKELGRLDDLRQRIAPFTPADGQQQRSRQAMLVLLDTAQGDFTTASENLQQLFRLVQAGTHTSFFERCPETIAIWAALHHAETRSVAREMLILIVDNQLRRNIDSGEPAWETHIQAMWGQANASVQAVPDEWEEPFGMPPALRQWSGTNRVLAVSRGRGNPQTHWQTGEARVENLVIHSDDYLFFQSPMRGNFEVECDITPFEWRDTTIFVAGKWVAPVYNLKDLRVGNVRGEQPRRPLPRKLARPREWFRYRAVVRDNVLSTYFNGLKIHEEPLSVEHEPWLAIRSVLRNAGVTRGLRITGSPVIPETVTLSASSDLPGWMPYYGGSFGNNYSDWRQERSLFGGGQIVGRYQRDYEGTGKESLLYYVRPMLEDGEIEYEFYYREGELLTHPALDRLAFVLDRGGVRIHWITDGQYDRTGLDPMNVTAEPQDRRGPQELPLIDNGWNHLRLSLAGDTVHLFLNGQEVYERELEPTNQRTFGLFHYADRTGSRVRNIVWKGDWPGSLPAVNEQELAGEGTDFLDEDLPKLTAVFEHDFKKGGLPADRFTVFEEGWQNFIAEEPDGVHVTRPGQNGKYLNYSIVPRLTIKGDFDITASYKNFEPMPESRTQETKCAVILSAVLNDELQTRTYLFRRHIRTPNRDDDRLVQGAYNQVVEGDVRRHYFGTITFEAESGTLRLARRGKTLYFLVAEHDSSYYRLIGEQTLSDADLHPEGLRLHTQTAGPGACRAVWTHVAIRAEEIVDPAAESRKQILSSLERQLTGELPDSVLEFDGRTQYVSVPSIRYDGSYPVTLEAYVTHDRLRSVVIGDTQQSGFALGVPSTNYNMHAWNGNSYDGAVSTEQAPTNLRVHLAGTFDGKTLAVFVNGKLLKSSPLKGVFGPSGFPLTIGASPSPNEGGIDFPFAGLIDEVRVSKTVRYTEDFKPPASFNSDVDTLAVYHFDEGKGETLHDSSGNRHHGEIRGAKWVDGSTIRHRAALGLAELGRDAVEVLTSSLSHQNPDVRIEAATALGLIGKDAMPAISALQQLSGDTDSRVAKAADQALSKIE